MSLNATRRAARRTWWWGARTAFVVGRPRRRLQIAYIDTSTITPCRTYNHRRDFGAGTSPKMCSAEMLKCTQGDALDMSDILAALANADVIDAMKAAPVLYSRDSRPVDGKVYRVDSGGKVIDVGGDCGAMAGCKPAPGVKALASLPGVVDTSKLRPARERSEAAIRSPR